MSTFGRHLPLYFAAQVTLPNCSGNDLSLRRKGKSSSPRGVGGRWSAVRGGSNARPSLQVLIVAEVVTSCDHLGKLKFSKSMPYVFTEHGAIQATNLLASPRAVEMGIYVVQTSSQARRKT